MMITLELVAGSRPYFRLSDKDLFAWGINDMGLNPRSVTVVGVTCNLCEAS